MRRKDLSQVVRDRTKDGVLSAASFYFSNSRRKDSAKMSMIFSSSVMKCWPRHGFVAALVSARLSQFSWLACLGQVQLAPTENRCTFLGLIRLSSSQK